MKKTLISLAIAGCMAGGEPSLVGEWKTIPDNPGCYLFISLSPSGRYVSHRECPPDSSDRRGTYVVDGETVHVETEDGPFDMQWRYEPHADRLWMSWEGLTYILTKADP